MASENEFRVVIWLDPPSSRSVGWRGLMAPAQSALALPATHPGSTPPAPLRKREFFASSPQPAHPRCGRCRPARAPIQSSTVPRVRERSIDWSSANVDQGDVLRVPLTGDWDETWNGAFMRTVEQWQRETRGQTWRGVQLVDDAILVYGVDDDTSQHDLQRYLENAVRQANQEALGERQRAAQEQAREEQDAQERRATAERLTERFRTPPS